MSALACGNCGAYGVRLDLDVRQTPPEHVCVKCLKLAKCRRCGKRRARHVLLQLTDSRRERFGNSICVKCDSKKPPAMVFPTPEPRT